MFDALNPRIAGNIPSSSGSSPVSLFWLAVRNVSPGTLARPAGKRPVTLLREKRTLTSDEFSAPGHPSTHSFGKGPVRELFLRSIVWRLGAVASDEGIVPVSLFPRATRYLSAEIGFDDVADADVVVPPPPPPPPALEIVPESLLSATSSSLRAGAESSDAGIEPVNAFEYAVSASSGDLGSTEGRPPASRLSPTWSSTSDDPAPARHEGSVPVMPMPVSSRETRPL